ncbi:hypothetical protein JL720_16757 [Aureococcus anophagefferens]|nr:hypothetical protein JL720_16757 [Aureococcus anophagefferens]
MAADAAGDLGAVAAWARTFAGCEAAEASKLGNGVALSLVFAEVSGDAAGLDVTGDLGESNWALGAGRLRRLPALRAEWPSGPRRIAEAFELKSALELKDAELRRCREDLEEASEARRFFEEELAAATARSLPRRRCDAGADGGDDFAPVFGESAAQLRAKVARLERENQRLRPRPPRRPTAGRAAAGPRR